MGGLGAGVLRFRVNDVRSRHLNVPELSFVNFRGAQQGMHRSIKVPSSGFPKTGRDPRIFCTLLDNPET